MSITDDRDSGADVAEPVSVPVAADGAPTPAAAALYQGAAPIPAFTEENCACKRGPCRYYLEILSHFEAGNAETTHRQRNRYCTFAGGEAIDLVDDVVFECNQWFPLVDSDEQRLREMAREAYRHANPEIFEPQSFGDDDPDEDADEPDDAIDDGQTQE